MYGEVPVTGLSNTINTVYMLLPLAEALSSHLVLGPVYSRSSFEISMRDYDKAVGGKIAMHFSEMFDISSFQSAAANMGIEINLRTTSFEYCLTSDPMFGSQYVFTFQRNSWRSINDSRLLDLLQASGFYTNSLHNQCPHVLRVHSVSKLLGMYSFYHYQDELLRSQKIATLMNVHRHVRPAHHIQLRVTYLLQNYPATFWAVHIRVEADVIKRKSLISFDSKLRKNGNRMWTSIASLLEDFSYLRSIDAAFYQVIGDVVYAIVSHSEYRKAKALSVELKLPLALPALYVSSGVISTRYFPQGYPDEWNEANFAHGALFMPGSNSSSVNRGLVLFQILRKLGFSKFLSKLDLRKTSEKYLSSSLNAEQEAYIDFEVSRAAAVFLPAHARSSFSYLVQRLRELDRNVTSSTISKPNTAFRAFFV